MCEREREREGETVAVCVCVRERERECVCVCERERLWLCVWRLSGRRSKTFHPLADVCWCCRTVDAQ